MNKKELLAMAPLRATDEMVHTAATDIAWEDEITHKSIIDPERGWTEKRRRRRYLRYFLTAQEGGLLKVAIFTGDSLRAGNREPVYEVYVNKKENRHLTYEKSPGKWRTAKVSYLQYQGKDWTYCQEEWQGQADRDLANNYFGTGRNLSIYQAVLDFQTKQEEKSLRRKHQSETDQIDAIMREVPEIPGGFQEWVEKNCFKETMFYEPKTRGPELERMYCTHCGKWMYKPGWPNGPEHKKEGLCPECGAAVTYRSWNKQKYVDEDTDVGMVQRLKDGSGYVLREFHARRKRNHADGWETCEVSLTETARETLGATFLEKEHFTYGEYKYTGVERWCHNAARASGCYGYYGAPSIGSVVMYTENLREELAECAFGGMGQEAFRGIFKGGSRERVNPKGILRTLEKYPCLEYLHKSGLRTLEREIMEGRPILGEELFKRGETDIRKALQLDGQRFQRLKQWDGGCSTLRALQLEAQNGGKLSDNNIRYIISQKVDMREIEQSMGRTGMGLQQMLNYYERQQLRNGWDFGQTHRFYRDYLDMAAARGMDLGDDIVRRQARMKEYHDIYLEEKDRAEGEERDREVDITFPGIKADHKINEEHFGFECGEYIFIVPGKASDITREGRLQHHCVGASDRYLHGMNTRQSFIVFLRRKAEPSIPYYTIEACWDGEIIQWYAAFDRQPNADKIEKMLKKWGREVRKRETKQKMEQKDAGQAFPALQGA